MKVGSPAGELLFVSILKNAKRRWQRIRKYGKHSSDASAFERDASRHGGGCGGVRSKRSWWQKVYTNFFAARDACEVQLVLYCL